MTNDYVQSDRQRHFNGYSKIVVNQRWLVSSEPSEFLRSLRGIERKRERSLNELELLKVVPLPVLKFLTRTYSRVCYPLINISHIFNQFGGPTIFENTG